MKSIRCTPRLFGKGLCLTVGIAITILMVLPLVYLLQRALEADSAAVVAMLYRPRTLQMLWNTATLTMGVLAFTTVIAVPLAWLVSRTTLKGQRLVNMLAVLPLAVPGYVMAYALIGLSGNTGFLQQLAGFSIPRPQGWWGATLALGLYTFPYLYLNLRAAYAGLDRSQEESARALGANRWQVFTRLTLPHLRPALLAGWLVIGLYVIGDFGAVALMRYEAFSYGLYMQYAAAFDRVYAAWLALILIAIAAAVVWWESRLRHGRYYARLGSGNPLPPQRLILPWWGHGLAWLFAGCVALAAIGLPIAVLGFWMMQNTSAIAATHVLASFGQSLSVAVPAALLATALAVPVAIAAVRYPSSLSQWINRCAFIGYAVPSLAFALAFVFFTLNSARFLYQSMPLLIGVYALAFLALALAPVRSAFYQYRPSMEEAARSLGHGMLSTFWRVTLPAIRGGIVAGVVLVFVIAMKELPIAFLLAPADFRPLSITMFSRTSEGLLAEAAPFAAAIILFSALFVGVVLRHEQHGAR